MSRKYILGCGLSGLIFAYYNPDYEIISPDVGGKLQSDFLAPTILLHDNEETQALLKDLDIKADATAHIVKYLYKKKLHTAPQSLILKEFAKKKLSLCKTLPTIKPALPIVDGGELPPTSNGFLRKLNISSSQLVESLAKQVKRIDDEVLSITPKEIVTKKRERLKYDELISTLPAPLFWQLYEDKSITKPELKHLPVTFVSSEQPPQDIDEQDWDLINFVDANVPYTRVNRNITQNTYLYELTGRVTKEEIRQLIPSLKIKEYCSRDYIILTTDLNNIPPQKVRFLGRAAAWNHRLHIHHTIKEAKSRLDFASVWNAQKSFNAKFFDFNVTDERLRQKLTRDFVLHITDEAHELLHVTHWKGERYLEEHIDPKKVTEEWIDIFKYWLGLGNVLGISMEDFFHEFWRKSQEVESRYTPKDIERIRNSFGNLTKQNATRSKSRKK